MIKPRKLKNGMRVHLVPFAGTEATTVLVLTKVGSRYENERVLGGSHFIEHLMFKGTKKHPKTIDISRKLDRYGAEFNAYTGKDLTGYYVKIDGSKTKIAIDLLHDMLFHSKFDSKEMNKERGVIIEEIKMYEENPIMHLEDLLEYAMFDGSPLGKNIAGTAETMTEMKRSDLIKFRDEYYAPGEMVLAVAGNLPKNVMKIIENSFGKVKPQKEPGSFLPFGDLPERDTPRIERQYKPLEQIQIALGFPTPGRGHTDTPAMKLMAHILGGSMSSRLFIEVREKRGLCYNVRSSVDAYEDVGALVIRAGLDAKRLTEAMNTIFKELKKIQKGVSPDELKEAKDHFEGSLKLSLENSSNKAEFFGRQEIYFNEVLTPEDKIKKYKEVGLADIKRVAREIINNKKLSIAAIGPYKTDSALLKHFDNVL